MQGSKALFFQDEPKNGLVKIYNKDFTREKANIKLIVDCWLKFYSSQIKVYKASDPQKIYDWDVICRDTQAKLIHNIPYDCFLIYEHNKLEGIALCSVKEDIETQEKSYVLHELITAPWNFLHRCLEGWRSSNTQKGVGTSLLIAIVEHAKTLTQLKNITLIAGYHGSKVSSFYLESGFVYSPKNHPYMLLRSEEYDKCLAMCKSSTHGNCP